MIHRVGIGYDVHRLVAGLPLTLGGVRLEHTHGLEGHSDADVLLHAMVDALLGAASLGDIGRHFPQSDPRYRGASSLLFLEHARDLLREAGWSVVNLDSTVIAERPTLGPHVPAMRRAIAGALSIDDACVGIKATTNEGLGFAGREEGIAAFAVALLQKER
jgi:2-C-methyl-D-erythritol 2,4-cyclodiphosphate synthase